MKRAGLAALAAVAATLPHGASAQSGTEEAPWIKVCGTDPVSDREQCVVGKEVYASTGQFIASAALRQTTGEDVIEFLVAVPPGLLLRPGMRAQVDTGEEHEIQYDICFQNRCMGRLEVDGGFVDEMKAGGSLTIRALNQEGVVVPLNLSLIGFTAAFDSAGDPAVAQNQANELREALERRVRERNQRLIEGQQSN